MKKEKQKFKIKSKFPGIIKFPENEKNSEKIPVSFKFIENGSDLNFLIKIVYERKKYGKYKCKEQLMAYSRTEIVQKVKLLQVYFL